MGFAYRIDGKVEVDAEKDVLRELATRLSSKEDLGFLEVSAFDGVGSCLWNFHAGWDREHAYVWIYTSVAMNDLHPGDYQKRYSADLSLTPFEEPMGIVELESGILVPRDKAIGPLQEWLEQRATSNGWEPIP